MIRGLPTKTGPRADRPKTTKRERREVRDKRRLQAQANEGYFFFRKKTEVVKGDNADLAGYGLSMWGATPRMPDKTVERMIRIAKITPDGETWIRRSHVPDDTDPTLWSKLSNASKERIYHEIKQVGAYHSSEEMDPEQARELLDLLYAALEAKL
jgi:hypothetical protein